MVEDLGLEQLRAIVRTMQALDIPPERTVLLCRREIDPATGRPVLRWVVEPAAAAEGQ
ncbi:MAG TPA: hypothetical protein VFW75_07135 [Acetobacteraceae bacterium]|nr:hypothetical protein [Acetobacteraceae bacterium]